MPSEEQIRLAPDLDELTKKLTADPELLSRILKAQQPPRAKISSDDPFESMDDVLEPEAVTNAAQALDDRALDIVAKVRADGEDADLSAEEEDVFEAIIHAVGRPALFISGGTFINPAGEWEVLEDFRPKIEANIQSVGRIEVEGHPKGSWWGTGFLVADDVIMTNRHVAKKFCFMHHDGTWHFRSGMTGRIDFIEEAGVGDSAEFDIIEIIGVHNDPNCDLALFRIKQTAANSGNLLPPPLTLATQPSDLAIGNKVYVIGYPAFDPRNDVGEMTRIFGSTYAVKRLQPGKVSGILTQPRWMMHDCSTLGGNSGSCVVDLVSNRVLGLHFKGSYMEANFAVALWRLQDDPLIKKAGLNFCQN